MYIEDMTFLVDMDGVVADFIAEMCYSHDRNNPWKEDKKNLGFWDMAKLWGMSEQEFWEPANFQDWWEHISPKKYGFELIRFLLSKSDRVYFCTTPSNHPGSAAGKVAWIQRYFPELARKYTITCNKPLLASYDTMLIDDRPKNCIEFCKAGGLAFLWPDVSNQQHEFADDPVKVLQALLEGDDMMFHDSYPSNIIPESEVKV